MKKKLLWAYLIILLIIGLQVAVPQLSSAQMKPAEPMWYLAYCNYDQYGNVTSYGCWTYPDIACAIGGCYF